MLQAMLSDGTLVTLANYTRKEIENFRKSAKFYCPSCQKPVIIKAGKKVIPHFAHVRSASCPLVFGESIEHEHGKYHLYQYLKRKNLPAILEKYLPYLKQTPDIFIQLQERKIALEYQRASIPIEEVQNRTLGYLKANIIPLWILGENHFKRLSADSIKITSFLKAFIHKFSYHFPATLYFFCPKTKRIAIFQDLYFTSNTRAFGNISFFPLKSFSFLQFFQRNIFPKNKLYRLWGEEKKRFRLRPFWRARGKTRKWLEWLYQKGVHWEQLPSIVYLPIRNQLLMKTPLWDWQSHLVIDLLKPLSIGETFSLERCFRLLENKLTPIKTLPLYTFKEHPILEYLLLLERLHFVEQKSKQKFVKLKSIEFNKNIEDAIINDKLLINTL